jgi:hypothetical protein
MVSMVMIPLVGRDREDDHLSLLLSARVGFRQLRDSGWQQQEVAVKHSGQEPHHAASTIHSYLRAAKQSFIVVVELGSHAGAVFGRSDDLEAEAHRINDRHS